MSNELFSLKNKVIFITGASSGIGEGLAKGLAQQGAKLVLTGRRLERLEKLVSEIETAGGVALAVALDVTDRKQVNNAFDAAESAFGVVTGVLNNAGVSVTKPFLEMSTEDAEFVFNTNIYGVWHVAQEACKRLVSAGVAGSILNIASMFGVAAHPHVSAYCASKGAVIQFTKALAVDMQQYNIRVNALAPGWFTTEMNEAFFNSERGLRYLQRVPAKRTGNVEELLGPVCMLLSDAASYMTGSIVTVDGGHTARVI